MQADQRIRQVAINRWPIYEGDANHQKDCPVKRAYKLGMIDVDYRRMTIDFINFIKSLTGKTPDECTTAAENWLKQLESEPINVPK